MIGFGECALRRKGIFLQPFQKLLAIGCDHGELRVMHVAIDKTGGNQAVPVIDDRRRTGALQDFRGRSHGANQSVLDKDGPVREVRDRRLGAGPKRVIREAKSLSLQHQAIGHAGFPDKVRAAGRLAKPPLGVIRAANLRRPRYRNSCRRDRRRKRFLRQPARANRPAC